jgi:DNA-binding NarL/FixJ family response regulator
MQSTNARTIGRPPAHLSGAVAILRARNRPIYVSIVDCDPVRFVGFSTAFRPKREFRVQAVTMSELIRAPSPDVALLTSCGVRNIFDTLKQVTSARPNLRILVTGTGTDRDEVILKALALGAKGCIDEISSAEDFVKAVRVVHEGLVWAPRRVCSTFIDVFTSQTAFPVPDRSGPITDPETEVMQMLILGRANKEIAEALSIQERTVKGHLAKLRRKTGFRNRVELSLHAVNQQLSPIN